MRSETLKETPPHLILPVSSFYLCVLNTYPMSGVMVLEREVKGSKLTPLMDANFLIWGPDVCQKQRWSEEGKSFLSETKTWSQKA